VQTSSSTPEERALVARIAAETSWANTTDRTARTAAGRTAFEQKFLDQCDGDPVRAASLRRAYFAKLALKSAVSRRKAKALTAEAEEAEAALLEGGDAA